MLSSHAADVCASNAVPVVMVNRVPRRHSSAVSCDNAEGGRRLAERLIADGHRRFAVIRGTPGASTSLDREQGFEAALQGSGATITHRFEGSSRYEGGFEAGLHLAELDAASRPDGVFAINDIMAMVLLDALRLRGVRVPQDLVVVGFDNIALARHPNYDLTTVAQPLQAMVRRGLDLLLDRIGAPAMPDETILLRGDLVERGSSRRGP
jgi:LacI family transcriptional regulator